METLGIEFAVLSLALVLGLFEQERKRRSAVKDRDFWRGQYMQNATQRSQEKSQLPEPAKIPKCMRCFRKIDFNEVTMFMCPTCMDQTADVTK